MYLHLTVTGNYGGSNQYLQEHSMSLILVL